MLFKPSKKELLSWVSKRMHDTFNRKHRQPLVDAFRKAETALSDAQRKTDNNIEKRVLAPYKEVENQINDLLESCGFGRCFNFIVGCDRGSYVDQSLSPGSKLVVRASTNSCSLKRLRAVVPNASKTIVRLQSDIANLKSKLSHLDRSINRHTPIDEVVMNKLVGMAATGDRVEKLLNELNSIIVQLVVDDKVVEAIADEYVEDGE